MKRIKLSNCGRYTLVDDEDFEYLKSNKWMMNKGGYAIRTQTISSNGIKKFHTLLIHQIVLGKKEGFITDHINRNRLDNRKANLRFATYKENRANQNKCIPYKKKNSTSEYFGVSKRYNKWITCLFYNGKYVYVGTFLKEKDAALAYNKKALELFGRKTLLNKIKTRNYESYIPKGKSLL